MKKLQELRKSRKGFTLVEIIVVLVILAILAAFTIPAMLGFVNDARSKAYVAEAREAYVAVQSQATEQMAANKTAAQVATAVMAYAKDTPPTATATDAAITQALYNMINDDVTTTATSKPISNVTIADTGHVSKMTYTVISGTKTYTMVYDDTNKTWNTSVK